MYLFIEKTNERKKISFKGSLKELLALQGINLSTVLLIKNKEVVLEDEVVGESDEVELLSVISGG